MKQSMDLSIARESTSLRQLVIDRLREAILKGEFAPGQKLVERDLCEMLEISRTVLREALQHLGAEGLITHVPHKGPQVATLSYKEAKDIYGVREQLEGLAGEEFALNATDKDIAELRAVLQRLDSADDAASTDTLLQIKNEFYAILLRGSGNKVVSDMLTLLNNRITMLRRVSLSRKGRLPHTRKELEAILGAIEVRDARRTKRLCAAHVRKAATVALKSLGQHAATNAG